MDESLKQRAFEMFREGRSVNQVAKDLFKNNWSATKKLHNEFSGTPSKTKAPTADTKPDETPESFDLVVTVEVGNFDKMWKGLTVQEKADALQYILSEKYA